MVHINMFGIKVKHFTKIKNKSSIKFAETKFKVTFKKVSPIKFMFKKFLNLIITRAHIIG